MEQRSLSLDIFKLVLSILVITAHIQPLFETRNLLEWLIGCGVVRIAVPCFFIINGYFLANKITDEQAIKKYLIHLLLIYLTWSLFYLYFYFPNVSLNSIILNLVMGYHHLWYLSALIVGVVLLFFFRKIIKNDLCLLSLVLILFAFGYMDEINQNIPRLLFGDKAEFFRYVAYKNGLFVGFPCITLGYLIKKRNIQQSFKAWMLVVICILSMATLLIESYNGFPIRADHTLYLSILLFCPIIIMLFIKFPYTVDKSVITEYLGYLPNGIYYIHVFFIFKLYSVNNNIYNIPAVFILSVLATLVLIFINRRLPVKIFL